MEDEKAVENNLETTEKAKVSDEVLADRLIQKLKVVPHHAISLRRNKYRVIRRIAKELGWELAQDKDASILWLDKWETSDMTNLRYSKVGHFLGMRDVASKCSLGRTLNRMKAAFPTDYEFHPVTFVLPTDKDKLLEYAAAYSTALSGGSKAANAMSTLLAGGVGGSGGPAYLTKHRAKGSAAPTGVTDELAPPAYGCWPGPGAQAQPQPTAGDKLVYIVKPDASSRGNGIYLALTLSDIRELEDDEEKRPARKSTPTPDSDSEADVEELKKLTLVQTYLPRPLLMDERKFDLRIYVLVTGAYPTLRAYIYRQGLVRFATEDYFPPNEANVRHRKMFLTNYAVNKATEAPGTAGLPDDFPDDESEASDDADALEEADPAAGASSAAVKKKKAGGRKEAPLPPRAKQRELLSAREGCKWSLDALLACLQAQGIDTEVLWSRIKDVITKTMLAIRASMAQKYRAARPQLRKEAPPAVPVKRKPVRLVPRSYSTTRRQPAPRPDPLAKGDALDAALAGTTSGEASALHIDAPASTRRPHSESSPRDYARLAENQSYDWRTPEMKVGDPLSGIVGDGAKPAIRAAGPALSQAGRRALQGTSAAEPKPALAFGITGTSVSFSTPKITPKPLPARTVTKPVSANSTPKMFDFGLSVSAAPAVTRQLLPEGASVMRAPIASRPIAAARKAVSTDVDGLHDPTSSAAEDDRSTKTVGDGSESTLPKKTKKQESTPGDEEDGEQGFRGYELMGLDVILDMSHCTCANKNAFQRVTCKPASPCPAEYTHRCQPRPVLLEINQSCSLHSDSDLDRIIKGDVVRDAFCMVAPDETWLLERFKEVLTMRADDEDSNEYDAAADKRRLSKAQFNDIKSTSSFDAIPEAHRNAEHWSAIAVEEARALVAEYKQIPPSGSAKPETVDTADAARGIPANKGEGGSPHPAPGALVPTNLGVVPWIPPPSRPLSQALAAAWKDEMWFGQAAPSDALPPSPSPRTGQAKWMPPTPGGKDGAPQGWAAFSLSCIPPLSRRAQLVLMLRRIYEHMHISGFQRLSPPTTPALVDRYRKIAEYVPPQLRETAAFVRRRQEALAIRAALEAKKPSR